MKYESYSEDLNLFLRNNEEQMNIMSAVGSVLLGDINADTIPFVKEFNCIREFLESPLNASNELPLKKIFASAVIIANRKGVLPFLLPESAEEIASMIDDGLTRLKVAYKQQIGELDIYEAADALIDKVATRTIALVENAVEIGLPIVSKKIAMTMYANPYTAPIAPFVEHVLPYVAEPVKKIVCNGIKVVAEVAKKTIHNAIDYIKVKGKNIAATIAKKLNTIFTV